MRIEAFSRGKIHASPQENEDALVVLPGLGYAVVDGVSDRSGRLFAGVKGGRFAAACARRATARFLAGETLEQEEGRPRALRLVAALDAELRAGYARLGLEDDLASAPERRAGCAFAAIMHDGEALLLASVGDCGARVETTAGRLMHLDAKPLDDISTALRVEAWRAMEAKGAPRAACARAGEMAAGQGLGVPPEGLSAQEAAAIGARVAAGVAKAHPGIAAAEIAAMIAGGVSTQRAFANRPDLGLGYGVVDGYGVPERFVETRRFARGEARGEAREGARGFELFTDGYFEIPEAAGLEAFEAAHARVEREDFDKLGRYASVKGSADDRVTDDRSYLRVVF